MASLVIKTPRVFRPLLEKARYKGAWGGRGSGKSHFFAEMLVEEAVANPGMRTVCIREIQRSLKDSAKLLIEDKIQKFNLGPYFDILNDSIRTPGGGVIIFAGMQDHTAESIKSLEGFHRAWIEEASTLSERSLALLRPTIRHPESQIWASWNPRRKTDAVDAFMRGAAAPKNSIVVKANWSDNPFFPDVLNDERLHDLEHYPDRYGHIWEGEYAQAQEGAYYAKFLSQAMAEGRISKVARDPLMTVKAFWDIGGTGAKADACAIWIAQFVGKAVHVIDYYEAVGQPLATHVAWLRDKDYGRAQCYLPHDGVQHDKVYAVSYESELRRAGFDVTVVPNQGRGADAARIEVTRRLFPSIWFNADTTEAGRDALGYYHEKRDEIRRIGLGPDHDWSSHCADAFGLMAVVNEKKQVSNFNRKINYPTLGVA